MNKDSLLLHFDKLLFKNCRYTCVIIYDILFVKAGILSYYITCDHKLIPNPFVEVMISFGYFPRKEK